MWSRLYTEVEQASLQTRDLGCQAPGLSGVHAQLGGCTPQAQLGQRWGPTGASPGLAGHLVWLLPWHHSLWCCE